MSSSCCRLFFVCFWVCIARLVAFINAKIFRPSYMDGNLCDILLGNFDSDHWQHSLSKMFRVSFRLRTTDGFLRQLISDICTDCEVTCIPFSKESPSHSRRHYLRMCLRLYHSLSSFRCRLLKSTCFSYCVFWHAIAILIVLRSLHYLHISLLFHFDARAANQTCATPIHTELLTSLFYGFNFKCYAFIV